MNFLTIYYDLFLGGKRLKPTACPSLYLPTTAVLQLPNPYNRPKTKQRTIRSQNHLQSHDETFMNRLSSTSSTQSDSDTNRDFKENGRDYLNSVDNQFNSTFLSRTDHNKDDMQTNHVEGVENKFFTTVSDDNGCKPSVTHNDVTNSNADTNENSTFLKTVSRGISERGKEATLTNLIKTDRDAIVWTGVASLEQLDSICISVKIIEDQLYKVQFRMSAIDRVVLTLAKLKQNISFIALATLFDVATSTVSHYFSHTIQVRLRFRIPSVQNACRCYGQAHFSATGQDRHTFCRLIIMIINFVTVVYLTITRFTR